MGQLSQEPTIHHFAHPHPLELTTVSQSHATSLAVTICSCCSLRIDSGYLYACRTCTVGHGCAGFYLHVACSQMPALITHPSHPKHPLSLQSATPYPGGSSFSCDACGSHGTAFCYHCSECDFDLHPTCASKPLSVANPRHHHQLGLEFFPPYSIRAFSCDVCNGTGKNHWLYRCSSCEFDVHLECATSGGALIGQATVPLPQQPQPRPALQHYPSYPGSYHNNNVVQNLQPQPQQYHHLQHQNSAPANLQNYQYQPQQMIASHYSNTAPTIRPAMAPGAQQLYQQQMPAVHPMTGGVAQQMYQQPRQQPLQAGAGQVVQQGNNANGLGNNANGLGNNANGLGNNANGLGNNANGLGNMLVQSFLDSAAQQAGQTMVQDIMGGGGNGAGGNDTSGVGSGSSGGSSILGTVLDVLGGGDGGDS